MVAHGPPRPLIVTNVLSHYRKPLFERLADRLGARFLFFSDGRERYWGKGNADIGDLPGEFVPGRWVAGTRVNPQLPGLIRAADPDVVIKCINGRVALPLTFRTARRAGLPFVLWTGLWQHPGGPAHTVTRPLVRSIYRRSGAILTYGRHVSAFVRDEGADPTRIVEAPQAVDMDLFRPQAVERRDDLLLYVGRLEQEKGIDVLLDAVALLARRGINAQLRVIGTGALADESQARARGLGIADRVEFLGSVHNAELPCHYSQAAITVVPSVTTSRFAEPWSLAANEAMACGSVVVATDAVGAVHDGLVADHVTGLVVTQRDPDALASAMAQLLSNVALRAALAKSASQAVSRYSYNLAVAAFARAIDIAVTRPLTVRRPVSPC